MGRTVNGSWTAMVEPGGAARVKTQTRILGKREIRVRLTRGQVPTAPILEELERAGYNPNHLTTPRMVYRWRVLGYMAFGSADRVMTAASLALRWHSPEQYLREEAARRAELFAWMAEIFEEAFTCK